MEIKSDVQNKLLGRREVVAVIENDSSTLSRLEVKKKIAKQLKVDEELIIVNHAKNKFGDTNVEVKIKVYDSVESLKTNARPHMVKRNSPKKEEEQEE